MLFLGYNTFTIEKLTFLCWFLLWSHPSVSVGQWDLGIEGFFISNINIKIIMSIINYKDKRVWTIGTIKKNRDTKGTFELIGRNKNDKALVKKEKSNRQQYKKKTIKKRRLSNTNPTNNLGWSQVLRNRKQIMLHIWHLSCCSCVYKPGDKSN